jgi:hypothetical protein
MRLEGLRDTKPIKRALRELRELHLLLRTSHGRNPVDGQWKLDLYAIGDGHPPNLAETQHPTYDEVMREFARTHRSRGYDEMKRKEIYKAATIKAILADVEAMQHIGEQMNMAGYLFGTHAEDFNLSEGEALRLTLERHHVPALKAAKLTKKFGYGFKAGLLKPKRMPPLAASVRP